MVNINHKRINALYGMYTIFETCFYIISTPKVSHQYQKYIGYDKNKPGIQHKCYQLKHSTRNIFINKLPVHLVICL